MQSFPPRPPFTPKNPPVPLDAFVRQEIPRTEWAIEGVWPKGAKGILSAPPKNGKSTLTVELAVSLATRTPLFGIEKFACHERARVTYLHQGENSAARIRKDLDLILQARGLGVMDDVMAMPPRTVNQQREMDELPPLAGPAGEHLVMAGETFEPAWGDDAPHPTPDLELVVNPGLRLAAQGGMVFPGSEIESHREWLAAYAADRDYLIIDPIYTVAGISMNDEPAVIELLGFLNEIHESGCAVIFSHQQSIKARDGSDGARMLGSTYLPAWYEAALFPKRDESGVFRIGIDNLREMSETDEVTLTGLGVGRWLYVDEAQNLKDSRGRSAPKSASKVLNRTRVKKMREERPDITLAEMAQELGVTERSIRTYLAEILELDRIARLAIP